jgi:Type IV secretion-system coupling protein DNA-binding domain
MLETQVGTSVYTPHPDMPELIVNLRPDICYFGQVNDRGLNKKFGVLQDDRRRHMYILGKSGMGKSTLLENMILQDIYNGHGVCFMDPHGDSSETILDRIPKWRKNDVVYFNPGDMENPIGFNMLEAKRGEQAFLIASGMMAVFGRIWAGMWSSRMEYILNNTLLALLETPGNTLLGVVRMLTDKDFMTKIVNNCEDPMVKNFWIKEFGSFNDKYRTEAIAPILNKIGQFFSTDLIRNILGQPKSTIDFRDIMDNKKILIVNLSKGKIGEDNSNLLGSFIVTKLQLAAMSRVDIPEHQRNDFYLYVDEFQNFTTDSFATILSEARKYRLCLILAHQYISQLTESGNEKVRNAIFGNVSTICTFRVGTDDAEFLEREFEPIFTGPQLLNLAKHQMTLKLSIQGKPSLPFIAGTLPPMFDECAGMYEGVVAQSRERYATPVTKVKDRINKWLSYDYGEELEEEKKQKQAEYEKKKAEMGSETESTEWSKMTAEEKAREKRKRKLEQNVYMQVARPSDAPNSSNRQDKPYTRSFNNSTNKPKSTDSNYRSEGERKDNRPNYSSQKRNDRSISSRPPRDDRPRNDRNQNPRPQSTNNRSYSNRSSSSSSQPNNNTVHTASVELLNKLKNLKSQ